MRIHRWLDLKVTTKCNGWAHKCDYCAVDVASPERGKDMPLELVHQTLVDARALGFDMFWLLGGEPTLHAEASALFDPLLSDPAVYLTLVSNGREANWPAVQSLFTSTAQSAIVQVSLDSLDKENTKHTCPSDILALISAIKREAGRCTSGTHCCDVQVHAVITRKNLHSFGQMVRFFSEKDIGVSLAMVCPWRLRDNPRSLNEFTASEAEGIARAIEELAPIDRLHEFNILVSRFIVRMLSGAAESVQRKCGAGLTHVVVNADASVYRCMADSFDASKALGNLRQRRLHVILGQVYKASCCRESTDCFDGYAWDHVALEVA